MFRTLLGLFGALDQANTFGQSVSTQGQESQQSVPPKSQKGTPKPVNRRSYGGNIFRALRVPVPRRHRSRKRSDCLVVDRETGAVRRRYQMA